MKKYLYIYFYIIGLPILTFAQEYNYEQIALQYFLDNNWNQELFKKECTGLEFNKNFEIDVYDSSFHSIWCEVYSEIIFGFSEDSIKPREKIKHCRDFEKGNSGANKLNLNLNIDKKLKKSLIKEAPYETEFILVEDSVKHFVLKHNVFSSYLLRFSYRYKFNGFTFIELWIKQSYHNSGVNILFKFKDDKIVDEEKMYFCDEWG